MKQFSGFLLVMAMVAVLLTGGCKQADRQQEKTIAGYEVTDSTGYVVKLAHKPERIVSLSLGTDEMLLGLVPVERIAALTYLADNSSISAVAEQAGQVSHKIKYNAEAVIVLQPDLVIVADWMSRELIQTIRDAGIAVYVYKTPNNINEIKQTVMEIAHVVDEEQQGKQIIAGMNAELERVAAKVRQIPPAERQRVVVLSFMGAFGGKGSLFDDLCENAGVINGAAEAGLIKNETLSKEQIVKIDPDLLLLPAWDYNGEEDAGKFKAYVAADPALRTIKAVRRQRLIQVPERYLYSVSQYAVYGVRELARAAYPGNFEQE